MNKLRVFAFWFCAEAFIYALVVANGRAYNQANYLATLFTDMMISGFNFWFAVKFIEGKDNRTWPALAGCVLGGGSGSLVAILITTRLYGQ
jgi:hypothetical protein